MQGWHQCFPYKKILIREFSEGYIPIWQIIVKTPAAILPIHPSDANQLIIHKSSHNGFFEFFELSLLNTHFHFNQPFGRDASAQIGMKECRQTTAFLVK